MNQVEEYEERNKLEKSKSEKYELKRVREGK